MKYSLIALAATAICGASAASHHHRRHNHDGIFKRYEQQAENCKCSTYVTSYVVPVTSTLPLSSDNSLKHCSNAPAVYPSTTVTVVPVYESETPTYGADSPEETPACGNGVDCPDTPVYNSPEETPACGNGVDCPETPVYNSPEEITTPAGYPQEVTTTYVTSYQTSTTVEYVTATEYELVPTPEVVTYPQPGTYTIPAKTKVITATETAVYPETTVLVPGKTETYGGITTVVETETVVTCPYVAVETSGGVTLSKVYETVYECPTAGTYTIGAHTTVPTETTTIEYGVPTEYAPGTYVQPEITTTITKTDVVVTCPYETIHPTPVYEEPKETPVYEKPAVEEPVYTPKETPVKPKETPVKPKETPVYTPKETPVKTPEYDETVKKEPKEEPTYTPKPTTAQKKPTKSAEVPKKTATPKTPTGGSGKYWAITYSPFSDDHGCKSAEDIASDIADIASKGFSNVRIYSTECYGLKNIGKACRENGIGMIVGLFIKDGGISTSAQDLKDLIAWNGWDLVKAVIVGNEAIFNNYVTAGGLVEYISTVRQALKDGPGYTGPISTAETVGALESHPELCAAVDFVGVNIQPYFDGGRTSSEAGAFLKSQLQAAEKVCGGKEGYILEAGWPSAGKSNGKAIASPEDQKIAVTSYEKNAPGHVSYFTYRNDGWKSPGIEQNFGCAAVL